jgi:pimeloyl-ACP methyl ester carboxylesterase
MAAPRLIYRKGSRIAYDMQGEGPLVVLIQGLGMTGRNWLGAPARLADAGFTVVTVDNRGAGRSEVPLPPYRMREMARDVIAVMEHIRRGPAVVAGISLGGMIAQHVTLLARDAVRGLVLAATTCGPPFGRLPRPRVLTTILRGLTGDRRAMLATRAFLVHASSLARDPHLFREFDRVVVQEGVHRIGVIGQIAAAAGHNTFFQLRSIRCPVEILSGDADVLVPTANAHILGRRIRHARVTILPNAGHAFPLEYPDAIPDAIQRVHALASA